MCSHPEHSVEVLPDGQIAEEHVLSDEQMAEVANHQPILYRPEGESRHSTPAEVCSTCSDFEAGRLVPASFCERSKAIMDREVVLYGF
jgi:hypothetical protein